MTAAYIAKKENRASKVGAGEEGNRAGLETSTVLTSPPRKGERQGKEISGDASLENKWRPAIF